MKKGLFIVFLSCISLSLCAQLTYQNLLVQYDSAITFKNLRIIPVRRKGPGGPGMPGLISFSEAIRKGFIVISERGTASTENVHWLRINNNSNHPVFIASGEVVLGGRQDRMVSKDTIMMPAGRDQYIPVMCVEEGRWSDKEKKFVYFNYANPRLRKVLDGSRNQVVLWREIIRQLDSNRIKSAGFEYAATRMDKKMIAGMDEYFRFFREKIRQSDSSIVGIVCVSGKKVIGSDIFDNSYLFYGEVEALLHGYIEEALASGSPPALSVLQVRNFVDQFLKDETSQAAYLKDHGKLFRYQGRVVHLLAYGQD